VGEVAHALARGYTQVLDADLTASVDSIPHDRLLAAGARRASDRSTGRLLRQWLRAPVVIERLDGKREVQGGQRTRRGTPQGGAISPLLANLYLHAFNTAWRAQGLEQRLQARLIRYADDFVICGRQTAAQVQPLVTQPRQALGLTLNPATTRVLDARQQPFTFLGFTVRVARSWRRGTWFPLTQPSAAARQELREAVKVIHCSVLGSVPPDRHQLSRSPPSLVQRTPSPCNLGQRAHG
jgi:RNA-directed DNA polymerase